MFNLWSSIFFNTTFLNSVLTSQKAFFILIISTNPLIVVYSKNHVGQRRALYRQNTNIINATACVTCSTSCDKDDNEVKIWSKRQEENAQQEWELLKPSHGYICLDRKGDNIQTCEILEKIYFQRLGVGRDVNISENWHRIGARIQHKVITLHGKRCQKYQGGSG
jgi:hypothetical protein